MYQTLAMLPGTSSTSTFEEWFNAFYNQVRGLVPRYVVDVVDAVAIFKGVDRIEVVRIVLKEWADEKIREAAVDRTHGDGQRQ